MNTALQSLKPQSLSDMIMDKMNLWLEDPRDQDDSETIIPSRTRFVYEAVNRSRFYYDDYDLASDLLKGSDKILLGKYILKSIQGKPSSTNSELSRLYSKRPIKELCAIYLLEHG